MPYFGLFGGELKTSEISNHVKSNIYVVEEFLDVKFSKNVDNYIIKLE